MRKTVEKNAGGRWIRAEITLENGRLSISGSKGRIISEQAAKREAFRYWLDYFEEEPGEIYDMKNRFPAFKGYCPKAAARFVLAIDGAFHGLDVDKMDGGKVYIVESCGKIVDELRDAFPVLAPLLPYHLNDMHSECEHQEKRGETYAKNPGSVCPDCGYKLGSGWTKRELPVWVIDFVNNLK